LAASVRAELLPLAIENLCILREGGTDPETIFQEVARAAECASRLSLDNILRCTPLTRAIIEKLKKWQENRNYDVLDAICQFQRSKEVEFGMDAGWQNSIESNQHTSISISTSDMNGFLLLSGVS
jgi:hypothetical protein